MANVAVGRIFFSLVTNSTVKLKINICILELLILFFEDILFLYYMQVIGFCFFFWEKFIFLTYFIVLFPSGYVPDLMMYLIWYTIHFFPKIEKGTFRNQFIFWTFTLGSKINFLIDFIKNKKCKNRLKYFTKIELWKEGKLKLVKS